MNLDEYLKELGFNEDEIDEIMIYAGNDIDINGIKNKVEYLHNLGCSSRIIRITIEENPLFLLTELEEIKKVIEYVKEKGLEEYITDIIEVEPEFLSTPIEKIRKNEEILKLVVPESNIKILLRDRTVIYTYNNDYLANRLRILVENGLKSKIAKIILSNIEIFDLEDDEINFDELK